MNSGPSGEIARPTGGLFGVQLPPRQSVWEEVRKAIVEEKARMDSMASVSCEDPAIVIEFLRTANSMAFSGGRPPVATIKGAVERLGIQAAIETLEKMKDVPPLPSESISKWFELARDRCIHVGRVSRMFAEVLQRSLVEDCEVAGCLIHTGELVAVIHFGEQYVQIAEQNQLRSKILYRLERDHKFIADAVGVNYLRRLGIPEIVLCAIDASAQTKVPARAPLRPLCTAASELVMAWEGGKLDKLAPGSTSIPPKSAIRILKMSDTQYEQIFEKVSAYLLKISQPTQQAAG